MLDHVGIQVADVPASKEFYGKVLTPLGYEKLMDFEVAVGFGRNGRPQFWIGAKTTESEGREVHIAFEAENRDKVKEFFEAAVAAGVEILHEPREWPEYHEGYFGAFVRDLDGNNVEAVCHS